MSMAQIKLGNLLWRPHTRPISPEDPVDVKDVNTADIKTKLEMVQSELALVKAELQEIKANQLSGDQKVQLSGTIAELPGYSLDDRPDYTQVTKPTIFILMPSLATWYTDGSRDWVVI